MSKVVHTCFNKSDINITIKKISTFSWVVMSITLSSYFEKIAHIRQWFQRIYLRGFVALCIQISVAGANKVEGTMSCCVGTNEILASKMRDERFLTFTRLKVKQGHFENSHLDSSLFFRLLITAKGV